MSCCHSAGVPRQNPAPESLLSWIRLLGQLWKDWEQPLFRRTSLSPDPISFCFRTKIAALISYFPMISGSLLGPKETVKSGRLPISQMGKQVSPFCYSSTPLHTHTHNSGMPATPHPDDVSAFRAQIFPEQFI